MMPIIYQGSHVIDATSFGEELTAAGLADNPFSFGDDGEFQFHYDMPQGTIDAILAVYDAHDAEGGE